ncbi:hypothetical protein BZG01_16470 [Labilibaculum manganireducens]|uniref:Type VI secretion system-associated protein n=1 Tax=Labilibaculum manganireducens TaxID=1940525 RepID=A0A2N3HY69_9BACT|nr:hypothetical protein [Labilibaculum manganireducens]PKQ62977.1 hypothetical protein BZG01_16470 [Labilibaculum manganireducens]
MVNENDMFLPVNWVDGMNINKKHFIAQENSFIKNRMEVAGLSVSPLNFGLVRSERDFLWMDIDNNIQLLVTFKPVGIVFPSGFSYAITNGKEFKCDLPKTESDAVYYVVLSIDPFSRQPIGMANAAESPVRKPFVAPEMKISILEEDELSEILLGQNHLVFGKITKMDGSWGVDSDYIIASRFIASNPDLFDVYKQVETYISSIEKFSSSIINKIRLKKQDNPLAKALNEICCKLLDFLSVTLSRYRIVTPYDYPVEMVILVMDLARIVKNSIDGWQACGKDEFMTYISDWCNINEGEFEDALNRVIKHRYDHNKISISVDKTIKLLSLLEHVLQTLSGLDYIGKKIETDLFVKEETLMEEEIEGTTTAKKKRPFFFGKE